MDGVTIELSDRISTHAPRVRRDRNPHVDCSPHVHFYSRASCEARPELANRHINFIISTHAPRVRRDLCNVPVQGSIRISTHAPRVRRDAEGCN